MADTLARAGLAEAWPPQAGQWPWATFAVNLAGCALLGWVLTRGRQRALLAMGFCGALTTFSAFQLELLQMADAGRPLLALAYGGASVAAGLGAVALFSRRGAA